MLYFSALLRQDPRYYRVAEGSIVHRGVNFAVQALVRRGDNGHKQETGRDCWNTHWAMGSP